MLLLMPVITFRTSAFIPFALFIDDNSYLKSFICLLTIVFIFMQPTQPELSRSIFTPEPGVREIVLIVAPPACGKTKLSRKFDLNLYSRINQDFLRTIDKCLSKAREELKEGKNIVVDNTNISVETRSKWIALARTEKVKVR